MLVHADVKSLELVTAAYLSGDEVLTQELVSGFDIHEDNRAKFKFEKSHNGRRLAKVFVFKLIYGGTAFGFANQQEFQGISNSADFWQKLIDTFYSKYQGIQRWHENLMREVLDTGRLVMPTGRSFDFPVKDVVKRTWYWKPKILNYPVQGTGADLVCIGRVTAWKRLRNSDYHPVLWQSTVHDSIDIDTTSDLCYNVCKVVKESIEDVPMNFERLFKTPFTLPITAEIGFGNNLKELTPYKL